MKKTLLFTALASLMTMSVNAQDSKPTLVDMGLSVHWTSINFGLYFPEVTRYNEYYRFGDLTGRSSSAFAFGSYADLEGVTVTGNPQYDPVTAKYGKLWMVPTADMFRELIENCDITTTSDIFSEKKMYRFTSRLTGNHIDLPVTGFYFTATSPFTQKEDLALYLTSTPAPDSGNGKVRSYIFNENEVVPATENADEYYLMIRAVYDYKSYVAPVSIAFDQATYEVGVGDKFTLPYTLLPENASDPTVTWQSCDTQLLSIDTEGQATALYPGTTTVTVTTSNGISATCSVVITGQVATPEVVDLGLSVEWATCNLGATTVYEAGDYYRLGDMKPNSTEGYSIYAWDANDIVIGGNLEYDIVTSLYGEKWQIPSQEMFKELLDNCDVKLYDDFMDTVNNRWIYYYKFTSRINGNSIILPLAGYKANFRGELELKNFNSDAYYLTSDIYSTDGRQLHWYLFKNDVVIDQTVRSTFDQYYCPIRPVHVVKELISPESLELEQSKYEINVGEDFDILYTLLPEDASNKKLTWESAEPACATVDENGHVTAIAVGSTTITATTVNGIKATCTITVTVEPSDMEYVDMGTSVMWATCNLGATKPSEVGNYYRYGTLIGYNGFKFPVSQTLYDVNFCNDPRHDAATGNLNINWHTPTVAELQELIDNCDITYAVQDEVLGREFTSKTNGNKLFIPASGYKKKNYSKICDETNAYLLSTNHLPYRKDETYAYDYYVQVLCNDEIIANMSFADPLFPIRPVYKESVPVEYIVFEKNEDTVDNDITLTPLVYPEHATCKNLRWENSNPNVVTILENYTNSLKSVKLRRVDDGSCEITAHAVDGSGAKAVFLVKNEISTSTEIIEIDLSKQYDVYDIYGRKVLSNQYYPEIRRNLSSGIYIVKNPEGSAIKINVRN